MTLPMFTPTAVPLLPAAGAVAVKVAVLLAPKKLVPPVVATMRATSPVLLPVDQALASCSVTTLNWMTTRPLPPVSPVNELRDPPTPTPVW
ncbi:hypothetical protein D9M72_600450 [compost metagenome]